MPTDPPKETTSWITNLIPWGVFIVLGALTALVTGQQVRLHRTLLTRHTEDACLQSSRRLQMFVESRLKVAEIFALRWVTHSGHDFSRRRFEEFAGLVVRSMPGYEAIGLVHSDQSPPWVVPAGEDLSANAFGGEYQRVLNEARRSRQPSLSRPLTVPSGRRVFFAALALAPEQEDRGFIIVKFKAETLISDCFHQRIRSEFAFEVRDGHTPLYRFAPEDTSTVFENPHGGVIATQRFAVANRTWDLTMVPRNEPAAALKWPSVLPVAGLGILLSLGLAGLAALLLRRMELYRSARDQAVNEVIAREKAQRALVESEARYRSVFDSAQDGLLVAELDGHIAQANDAACAMLGRGPEELQRTTFSELLAPQSRPLWDAFALNLLRTSAAQMEAQRITHEGQTRYIDVHGATFNLDHAPRMLLVLHDITELKHSERRHAILTQKVLVAQEEERARIARELHDELGQILTAARLDLAWLEKQLRHPKGDPASALNAAVGAVEKAAEELRHICKGLRPPLLDDLGLEPALQHLAQEFGDYTGLDVRLQFELGELDDGLTLEKSLCIYRVLQESLTNVGRHAQASEVTMTVRLQGDEIWASVVDNGRGFEMSSPHFSGGSGMTGMRERASLVDGTISIRSALFQGTAVTLRIPTNNSHQNKEAT